jgi:hypothetical protein
MVVRDSTLSREQRRSGPTNGKMPDVSRRLFTILSGLSLVLSLGAAGVWVRVYYACDVGAYHQNQWRDGHFTHAYEFGVNSADPDIHYQRWPQDPRERNRDDPLDDFDFPNLEYRGFRQYSNFKLNRPRQELEKCDAVPAWTDCPPVAERAVGDSYDTAATEVTTPAPIQRHEAPTERRSNFRVIVDRPLSGAPTFASLEFPAHEKRPQLRRAMVH